MHMRLAPAPLVERGIMPRVLGARRFPGVLAAFVALLTLLVPSLAAGAGILTPFELDGDAVDSPAGTPDDWANVYAGTPTALASAFLSDGISSTGDTTYFTGGGSKDTEPISNWTWGGSSVPDKNEVTDAAVATYLDAGGDMLLYLGIDRYDNNGAASMGFWLLQQPLALGTGGAFIDSRTGLPASHEEGDMLVVADFQGGTPTVRVFFWESGALVLDSTTVLDCRVAISTTPICGSANNAAISAPWPYKPKSGPANVFPVDAFLEVGLNLNDVLATPLGCINTVLAESRSSTQTNAQQKDLVLQRFQSCSIHVAASSSTLSTDGETISTTLTVTNTGAAELTLGTFTDSTLGDLGPAASAAGCDTLAPKATCTFTIESTVPDGSSPGALAGTATATYLPPNGIGTVVGTAAHSTQLFMPRVSLSKSGPAVANRGADVTYTFMVQNTSLTSPTLGAPDLVFVSAATPSDGGIVDDRLGDLTTAAASAGCDRIPTGGTCTFTVTRPVGLGDPDPLVNTATADYHPAGYSVFATATDSHSLAINDAPVANGDGVTTPEEVPVTIDAIANDTDPDGNLVAASTTVLSGPASGSLQNHGDGTFTYTPNVNYSGTDSFTYQVCDAATPEMCSSATVTITVSAVNDVPVATDDLLVTDEDTPGAVTVTANDTDDDGDPLTVTGFTTPSSGSVVDLGGGILEYTPNPEFSGSDSFTYTVCDPTPECDTATVSVTVISVNDDPVAVNDSYTTVESTPLTVPLPGVLGNDSDVEGDSIAVDSHTQPAGGSVAVDSDGALSFEPTPGFVGITSFTYTVIDGNGGSATATVEITVTASLPPVADDDTASTDEDSAVDVDVLANDSDPEGGELTIDSFTTPLNGSVTDLGAGILRYAPDTNFNGSDSFTYTVCDPVGACTTATVTITVNPVNDDPTAENDTYFTIEDTPLIATLPGVLVNDSDVDGDGLSVVSVDTTGLAGSLSWSGNGAFTYTPTADFNGSTSFTYTVEDGNGGVATATVTITVTASPDNPVAVTDTIVTDEDTPGSTDVLVNDFDVDGDTLAIDFIGTPSNGSVANLGGGVLEYTPDPDFNGSDSFTYTVSDGTGRFATATVNITVNPVNDDPVAVDDAASTDEDVPVSVNAISNDTDPDGDALTISSFTQAADGSVADLGGGVLEYTPDPGFFGTDSFTYTISDSQGGSATATVNVTIASVNDDPVAVDDTITTDEGVAASVDVLANDGDADGDTVTISAIGTPTNGSVADLGGGVLEYTPDPGFFGTDSFTYTISDGAGGSATATVNVTVNPVNDDPVAVDDSISTDEDTSADVTVTDNDSDPDGDTLTISSFTQPANGAVTDQGGGVLRYTPDANFHGADSFSYTVCDPSGACDSATVDVTVASVNDDPDAVDDVYSTVEDVPLSVSAPGILGNDTDVDGDGLTVDSVDTTGLAGNLSWNPNGAFTYTPTSGFVGATSFSYTVGDGNGGSATAVVDLTVTPSLPPVANDDSATVGEDSAVDVDVVANDSDPEGGALTIASFTSPTNGEVTDQGGGVLRYTPDPDFNGADSFTYTVCDPTGACDTATVDVTVDPANDPPTATDDTLLVAEDGAADVDVLFNDFDVDGDSFSIDSFTQPSSGTVSDLGGGVFRYVPEADYNGGDSFTYTICDTSGACDTATVFVTVDPVNDPPVAVDDTYAGDEDIPVSGDVIANDSDIDGDNLSVISTSLAGNGSVAMSSDGTFTYTPDPNFNGIDSFTYTISDGAGGMATATVTIDLGPVNDLPVAAPDVLTIPEDTSNSIDVLANDFDVDGDTIGVVSFTQPSNGTVVDLGGGVFEYTPNPDYSGPDSFTYSITDESGTPVMATVSITVTPVNDPPVALADSASVASGAAVSVPVLVNDSDVDGDPLFVASFTQGANGTVVDLGGGLLRYTPNAGFTGVDTFTYEISDGSGGTDTATVTVFVTPVNDPPVYTGAPSNTSQTLTIGGTPVSLEAIDANGDPLVYSMLGGSLPPGVTLNPDGSFSGTAVASGEYTVTVEVCDDGVPALCDTTTLTVVVGLGLVNLPPDLAPGFDPKLTIGTGGIPDPLPLFDPDGHNVTVTVIRGPLPPGLTLNPDGTFDGVATIPGVYSVTIELCDDFVPSACTIRTITIEVTGDPVVPPSSTTTTVVLATSTTVPPTATPGPLPFTGFDLSLMLSVALSLLVGGVLLARRAQRLE